MSAYFWRFSCTVSTEALHFTTTHVAVDIFNTHTKLKKCFVGRPEYPPWLLPFMVIYTIPPLCLIFLSNSKQADTEPDIPYSWSPHKSQTFYGRNKFIARELNLKYYQSNDKSCRLLVHRSFNNYGFFLWFCFCFLTTFKVHLKVIETTNFYLGGISFKMKTEFRNMWNWFNTFCFDRNTGKLILLFLLKCSWTFLKK